MHSIYRSQAGSIYIKGSECGHKLQQHNMIIGAIYRPPNQDISSFNDKINNIVNVVRREN